MVIEGSATALFTTKTGVQRAERNSCFERRLPSSFAAHERCRTSCPKLLTNVGSQQVANQLGIASTTCVFTVKSPTHLAPCDTNHHPTPWETSAPHAITGPLPSIQFAHRERAPLGFANRAMAKVMGSAAMATVVSPVNGGFMRVV